jgi:predicted Ser/Thr protein kinase
LSETGKIYASRYRIQEEVGRGGMAVVYRGVDERMKRTVAVKVLYPYLAIKRQNKVRFQREAEVVANLDHRNVVRIYDYSGIDSDENFIVTEYIEGVTLKSFVAQHKVTLPEVGAMMVRDIASALGHAHDRGITHRDVKPENVMINEFGVLKLMDFGIAQIKDVQQMTVTGTMIGSPAHMSPEHIEGRNLDHRADIFSLGTVLYLLCVGKLPFSGATAHALLKQILDVRYLPAIQANPAVGSELSAIIDRCLRREPDDRYQSCAELRLALEHALGQSGIEDVAKELAAFFAEPQAYQERTALRLVELLVGRARVAVKGGRLAVALRLYDRALCLAPGRDDIVDEIERVRRRGEMRRMVGRYILPLVALAIVVGCGWLLLASSTWFQGPTGVDPRPADTWSSRDVHLGDLGVPRGELTDVVTPELQALPEVLSPADLVEQTPLDLPRVAPEVLVAGKRVLRQVARMSLHAGTVLRVTPAGVSRVKDWAAARAAAKMGVSGAPKGNDPPGKGPVDKATEGGHKTVVDKTEGGTKGETVAKVLVPVTIVGNPSAVEIWVDGKPLGHGRLDDLMLTQGQHSFRLHHPTCLQACEDRTGTFEVSADRGRIEVREGIAFRPAMLQVVSSQQGVVFVNTEPLGRTNEIIKLKSRDQQPWNVDVAVLFEDDVSPPLKRTVEVAPGKLRKVHSD